jgi:DNA polymerase-1
MGHLLSYPDIEYRLDWIPPGDVIAVDTETTGLDIYGDDVPFLFSFANTEGEVGVVRRKPSTVKMLKKFFRDKSITKVYHNRKFDFKMCRNVGLVARGPWEDTLAMFRLIDENLPSKALLFLSKRFLGFQGIEDEQVADFKTKFKREHKRDCSYDEIPDEILHPYAGADAFNTIMLYLIGVEEVQKFKKFYNFDKCCHDQSMRMEDRGALIDRKKIRKTLARLRKGYKNLQQAVKKQTGMIIDPDDKKSLVYALFKSGETCKKLTEKGDVCVDKDVLPDLYSHVPWVPLFLKMKKLHKGIRDIVKLSTCLDSEDRVHTSFNMSLAVTGRSSSSNPFNLQNVGKIPYFRRLFKAPDDHYLFYFDYSQIEYRLYAHYSEDEDLIKGYNIGGKENDMHTKTANDLGVDRNRTAKIVNFLIIYGGGAKALAEKLKVSEDKGWEIINEFKQNRPSYDFLYAKLLNELAEKGYIEDLYGKHWHVEDDDTWKIINTKIQGTAANILKEAKLKCENLLSKFKTKSKMIMEIHDELIFEVHKSELHLVPMIKEMMEDVRDGFSVPFDVDVEYTDTDWNSKKEFTSSQLKEVELKFEKSA